MCNRTDLEFVMAKLHTACIKWLINQTSVPPIHIYVDSYTKVQWRVFFSMHRKRIDMAALGKTHT